MEREVEDLPFFNWR